MTRHCSPGHRQAGSVRLPVPHRDPLGRGPRGGRAAREGGWGGRCSRGGARGRAGPAGPRPGSRPERGASSGREGRAAGLAGAPRPPSLAGPAGRARPERGAASAPTPPPPPVEEEVEGRGGDSGSCSARHPPMTTLPRRRWRRPPGPGPRRRRPSRPRRRSARPAPHRERVEYGTGQHGGERRDERRHLSDQRGLRSSQTPPTPLPTPKVNQGSEVLRGRVGEEEKKKMVGAGGRKRESGEREAESGLSQSQWRGGRGGGRMR